MKHIFALVLLGLYAGVAPPTQADEAAQLRAENAKLKAQLEVLQKSCTVSAPGTASASPRLPEAAEPAPSAVAASAVPSSNAAPAASSPAVPNGYKLVKLGPSELIGPYANTGCSKGGLFEREAEAVWKHEENWRQLRKGMKPAEVEQLLGSEHYNVTGSNRLGWQYGKCGQDSRGTVVFADGEVLFWKKPDF